MENIFWHVSDPRHADYGNFIDIEQITQLIGPSEDYIKSFLIRLTGRTIRQYGSTFTDDHMACVPNRNRDWLTCSMPVKVAQQTFQVPKFHVYGRPSSKMNYIRTQYPLYISADAAAFIDYVGGAAGKLPSHQFRANIEEQSMREEIRRNFKHIGIYPEVIRARYNITNQVGGKSTGNSQCTPQFLEQYYHARDLNIFWKLYGGDIVHKDWFYLLISFIQYFASFAHIAYINHMIG